MKARAPGKIILSGEHAVVYGCPALALAVKRYAFAEQEASENGGLLVAFQEQSPQRIERPVERFHEINAAYEQFLAGNLGVSEILNGPRDLIAFAAVLAFGGEVPEVSIHVHSDIPIGCGMGSSAAVILAVLQVLNPQVDRQTLYDAAWHCENLQHGRSSGVDPFTCLQGGLLRFDESAPAHLSVEEIPPFQLVFTGKPEVSTGACVDAVRQHHAESMDWSRFSAVTERMQQSLLEKNTENFQEAVRDNHQLLSEIGVVPQKVAAFIDALDGPAKICGAGAVAGDAGGMVLVASRNDLSELVKQHGYEFVPVEMDTDGTQLI